jgi:hypothetical protein
MLDLSFVHELVRRTYAADAGRVLQRHSAEHDS